MKQYTKIPTIFERDMTGSKKLIEGRFRDETVEFLKDNEWVGTEKIDGTNIGVVWDGHRVSFQGRTEKAQIPSGLVNRLTELFGGDANEELFEQKFGEMQVILFGEGYGCNINKAGKLYSKDFQFILFDVYIVDSDLWMKMDAIEDIAQTFGIQAVPIVFRGTLAEAVDFIKAEPDSTIGTAKMEGIVCKPAVDMLDRMKRRIIVKVKVEDFK